MRGTDAEDTNECAGAGLWPSADYHRQVEQLRAAVGETVYIAELDATATQLGVQVTDHGYELLGLVDFPRPDPERGLAPHLILLDDGRGLNLGRVARVSRRPFRPAPEDVLYLDRTADQTLLFAGRRLSRAFIAGRARTALGQVLGCTGQPAAGPLTGGARQAPEAGQPQRDPDEP